MKDNISVYIQADFDCLIGFDENNCEIKRLGVPKCLELVNQNSVTMKVFPFSEENGSPYAVKLDFNNSSDISSCEYVKVFKLENSVFFVTIFKANLTSSLLLTKQVEAQINSKSVIALANCFHNETAITLMIDGKNLHCQLPFEVQTVRAISFAGVVTIVCESNHKNAVLLTDGKSDNIEKFLGSRLGFEENKIFVFNDEKTICKHATLTTLSEENKKLVVDSELMFIDGKPNLSFSKSVLPIAFFQCVKLQDFFTAEIFMTYSMRNSVSNDNLFSFFNNVEKIICIPIYSERLLYAITSKDSPNAVIEVEMQGEKINQIFLVN